jgi:hypothetical protein
MIREKKRALYKIQKENSKRVKLIHNIRSNITSIESVQENTSNLIYITIDDFGHSNFNYNNIYEKFSNLIKYNKANHRDTFAKLEFKS